MVITLEKIRKNHLKQAQGIRFFQLKLLVKKDDSHFMDRFLDSHEKV